MTAPRGALLAVLLLAACRSAGPDDPWPAAGADSYETVGWIDGSPVTYGDVARYALTKDPESFTLHLEGLVVERVTRDEARRAGVTVPRAALARATERRMREWDAAVRSSSRAQTGREVDPALWLERTAGLSLAQWRDWVRRHTETELLQDRLLRYEALTSSTVEVRLLVTEDPDAAGALAERARKGEDFAALAREHSVHATAGEGGRVTFRLLPDDVNDAAVRTALFEASPGEVVGPFAVRAGPETFHQVYRVESAGSPRTGSYAELSRDVARDLETRPVDVGEYERWRRRALLRHGFLAARATGEPQ